MINPNARFDGSIPAVYDRYLGPMLFAPYARDLAGRVAQRRVRRLLEIACGTGIVTEALRAQLGAETEIVATDLNEAMIAHAQLARPALANVRWRTADAMALPFPDADFDQVVCQFGLMFFPDKLAAIREIRRVLRPGGRAALSVWDSLELNPIGRLAHESVTAFLPADPPEFYQLPYGYSDRTELGRVLRDGGLTDVRLEVVAFEGVSESAEHAAFGLVNGNPVSIALRERGVVDPAPLQTALAQALAAAGGAAPLRLPMRAIVIEARAP
jgi:SAM-dependent methyltransferase